MGSYTSIHIETENTAHVLKVIQELSDADEMTYGNYPTDVDNYIVGENKKPSIVVVSTPTNGWISIYTNYFDKLEVWLEILSKRIDTIAIQILWQTVTDVYYFIVYEKGNLRRKIELYYGELENIVDVGKKFSFEKEFLIPQDNEDYENIFGRDDIEKYCKQLGFDLFIYDTQLDYYIFKKNTIALKLSKWLDKTKSSKPWWKFW